LESKRLTPRGPRANREPRRACGAVRSTAAVFPAAPQPLLNCCRLCAQRPNRYINALAEVLPSNPRPDAPASRDGAAPPRGGLELLTSRASLCADALVRAGRSRPGHVPVGERQHNGARARARAAHPGRGDARRSPRAPAPPRPPPPAGALPRAAVLSDCQRARLCALMRASLCAGVSIAPETPVGVLNVSGPAPQPCRGAGQRPVAAVRARLVKQKRAAARRARRAAGARCVTRAGAAAATGASGGGSD